MKKLKEQVKKIYKSDFFKNILKYSLIFLILISFLLYIYIRNNKSFIWNSDGFDQHFITLRYFRDLLVNFIRTGHFSTLTWYLGNGLDLFSNFAWYAFGDFFDYLSIFVRTADVEKLYDFLIILRIYFIGISYLAFAKYKKMNNMSSLIGALIYSFSSFVLWACVRHPYFLMPIMLLPLIMIGIEKIIIEDKKVFYTIIIAICYLSNFYFAYSISLFIAIYGLVLAIHLYKNDGIKKIIKVLVKTLLYSILGIMISSVVLLPTLGSYFNSDRLSGHNIPYYPLSYYRKVINQFLSPDEIGFWSCLGIQSLVFVTVPIFVIRKKKEHLPLFVLMISMFFPLLIAQVGSIFAGFNFPSNRWTFIFAFVFATITMIVLNEKIKIEKKDLIAIFFTLISFLAIDVFFEITISIYTTIQIILIFVWLFILCNKEKLIKISSKINLYNLSSILVIVFGILISIRFLYDVGPVAYASQFIERGTFESLAATSKNTIPNFLDAVNYIKGNDTDFYEISKNPYRFENAPLIERFNSTGLFYSIVPKNYAQLSLDLLNSDFHPLRGDQEFDYRTKINTLLGVKYLINSTGYSIPYGYSKMKHYNSGTTIYKNDYSLPFGVLYTNYITEDEYDKLSPLEKENSLIKTITLKDNINKSGLKHYNNNLGETIEEVKYEILDENGLLVEKNKICRNNSEKTFKLQIDDIKNKEIFVQFDNVNFKPFNKEKKINLALNENSSAMTRNDVKYDYFWYQENTGYDLKIKFREYSNSFSIRNWTSAYYVDIDDFLFDLGYYENTNGKISITFTSLGTYTFDDIKVYAVSMDDYEDDINNLRKSNFVATEWDNGYLNGTVDAESNGVLQFQTMYSDGWKVYVDGKEVKTLNVNKYFLGINIDKGKHEIHMEYHTPYFKEGILISLASIGIFVGTIIYNRKKAKKN